jgi:uncharacterized protein YjbI with pentapeptide repeats
VFSCARTNVNFSGDFRGRDFSGQDLCGTIFKRADLSRACFRGACLADAVFLDCFAAEACFDVADCSGLEAKRTNFYRASFRRADLDSALFRECVLAGADFRDAALRKLTLTLDCNSFEEVLLDRASSVRLAYLFGRLRSPHRTGWTKLLGPRERAWLERLSGR